MSHRSFSWPKFVRLFCLLAILCPSLALAQPGDPKILASTPANVSTKQAPVSFSVMTWNIWHGGREDGKEIGPGRVVDVIRDANVDIVAMQETYGSGKLISKALKFNFHPRGTNVSIHSRFPVIEDISVFEPFKCVGALVELPDGRRIAFYSIWLPYNKEIWETGTRDTSKPKSMLAACQASCDDLKKIKSLIEDRLNSPKYKNVPIVIAGDFNSMSHRDYVAYNKDQFGAAIDWPTSHVLSDDGFQDAYRTCHPEVDRATDRTWTPRFPEQEQDRIDYVYYRADDGLIATDATVIDQHPEKFPSDHAALVARFKWLPASNNHNLLRVASYNIRHGNGTDQKLNLQRTADAIKHMDVDIIGLQEVDRSVKRSQSIDQPAFLGDQTKLHPAFGSFMDYGGGQYGLAILSRFPITKQQTIRLPDGNEPRVALACEIQLPSGEKILAVNLHFDWVNDDKFRFAQAQKLADFLSKQKLPYILMGDFNDTIESRAVQLLSQNAQAAEKPTDDPYTFSSTAPKTEIDFVFGIPKKKWKLHHCRVLDAPKTSDHRPVFSVFELQPN